MTSYKNNSFVWPISKINLQTFLEINLETIFPEKFNVLWYDFWQSEARQILKEFEEMIIIQAKTKGYDGKEVNATDTQWNFPGSLLYSVTVITTIGRALLTVVNISETIRISLKVSATSRPRRRGAR